MTWESSDGDGGEKRRRGWLGGEVEDGPTYPQKKRPGLSKKQRRYKATLKKRKKKRRRLSKKKEQSTLPGRHPAQPSRGAARRPSVGYEAWPPDEEERKRKRVQVPGISGRRGLYRAPKLAQLAQGLRARPQSTLAGQ
jgi:hypothetical protein